MNNILTASRLTCAMKCLRQHFWSYEIGLRSASVFRALRFGGAWARAMEYRWKGFSYDECLAYAVPEGVELDPYDCHTVAALLAAYFEYHGPREDFAKMHAEVEFDQTLDDVPGFRVSGKLDGLGTLQDGRSALIESKTTGDSLAPESDFWLRLSFNMQVYQYAVEARRAGWDLACAIYDVVKKPSIKPKDVLDLDSDGRKIVVDVNGERVFNLDRKTKQPDMSSPRQSGDEKLGYRLKSHVETPEEFSDRLYKDALSRPEFYFARREVPLIDQQLESFERQRAAIGKLIISLRENEIPDGQPSDEDFSRDPEAWPRNVSVDTCNFCQYKSFCLQNITPDLAHPPVGFEIQAFNPELEKQHATESLLAVGDASRASA